MKKILKYVIIIMVIINFLFACVINLLCIKMGEYKFYIRDLAYIDHPRLTFGGISIILIIINVLLFIINKKIEK